MATTTVPAVPNLAVLLLLGGKSSRMGSPKHLLLHPTSRLPLYQHHLGILTDLHKEGVFPEGVYVSAREDQREGLELPEGVQVILDEPEKNGDIGPASGILQAHALKPSATWLLLAVDLPFVTRSSILHLLDAHQSDSPVSLFLHPSDLNPEPLFSVWTPPALKQLQENCKKGKSGPCRAAKDIWGGKIVEGKGGVKVLEENWVTDADTVEEWEKAVQALTSTKASHSLPPTPPLSPLETATSAPTSASPPTAFAPKRRRPIPYFEAIDRIHRLDLSPLPPSASSPSSTPTSAPSSPSSARLVPLLSAVGSFASSSVRALLPHPLHDNSAMDGYAVPSSLLRSASSTTPVSLPVLGRIVAGDSPPSATEVEKRGKEGVWEIMTGACFPSDEFDAVVKVEDTTRDESLDHEGRTVVQFRAPAREGQNRRRRGEQVRQGDVVLREREKVTPEKILLLAAVGISSVPISSPPLPSHPPPPSPPQRRGRVGILTTGKEILPLSSLSPGVEPSPGQVIDCVTPFLSAYLLQRGYEPVVYHSTGDSPSAFAETVSSALSLPSPSSSASEREEQKEPLSMLITTAGVSLGVTDHLPSTLSSLPGMAQIFHGVSIRPGAPIMLSLHTHPTSGKKTPVLSLPGNPMASAVGMRGVGGEVLDMLEGKEGMEEGWEEFEIPPVGLGEEEGKAWEELVGRVKMGGSSFFALPLDVEKSRPTLEGKEKGGFRAGPCAVGSLVKGQAWVRVDKAEGGEAKARWCRF